MEVADEPRRCGYMRPEPGHFKCFLPVAHTEQHSGAELGCNPDLCNHVDIAMSEDGVMRGTEKKEYCPFTSVLPGHFGCFLATGHAGQHRGKELGCGPEICNHANLQLGPDGVMRGDPMPGESGQAQGSSVNLPGALLGLTVGGIALAISLATYSSATSVGGTYVVLWGAVLWGAWRFLKSFGAF